MSEEIDGTVERVSFHNAKDGFVVLRVRPKGTSGVVTVVGHVAMVADTGREQSNSVGRRSDHLSDFQPVRGEPSCRDSRIGSEKGGGHYPARRSAVRLR